MILNVGLMKLNQCKSNPRTGTRVKTRFVLAWKNARTDKSKWIV